MNILPSLQKPSSKLLTLPLLSVIFFVISSILPVSSLYAQMDLPNPPANFETIPAGSFVIPMDTINQAIVPAGDAPFNIKAYGLVNKFLQNGIPVKWAIRAGKAKDAVDFSASASRVFPTAIGAANVNFVAGPFIVTDTVLPCGLSTTQIIQNFGNNVAVFQLQQSVSVDIRYTLVHRPKIAVFNNGGNQQIHIKILNAAGIPDYTVLSAAQITALADCFTFASEPHADSTNISMQMVNGIQQFVANGGNFLGQCQTVNSYENQGFYHTITGIAITNSQITNTYSNSDMAAAQIHGPLSQNRFGSCQNWTLKNGSAWRSYYYPMVTDPSIDTVLFVAAHLIAPTAVGGNVFFLGCHDYGRNNGPGGPGGPGGLVADLTDLEGVNGMRYYLNAALIPSYNSNAAWANAGPDISLSCGDSAALGCSQTGPVNATFAWSPSTGLSCTNCPNPIAHPSVTTTYIVTVATSCNATDTVVVTVSTTPNITVNNAAICPGSSVTLTGNGGVTYSWSPAAGLSGTTGASVSASPILNTSYTVTGTNASGCTGTAVAAVTINALPVISVNSPLICSGDSTNLTASGGVNYSWTPASGLNSTSGSNVIAQPGSTTIYTVTGTDANGCVNTSSSTVSVNAVPALLSQAASVCAGSSVVLNVSGTPAGSIYNWSTGNSGASVSVSPASNTTYIVTGTSPNGCTSSISVPVTVNQLPVIITADTVVCAGSPTTLHAQGAQNYSWIATTGQNYTGASVIVSPIAPTSYTVTGTDINGCINTAVSNVALNLLPVITSTSDSICIGETASLSSSGGVSYHWMPGNFSSSSITTSPVHTTYYTVTASDLSGCSNTSNSIVIVNSLPTITASSAGICFGDTTVIQASGASSYTWQPSGISGNAFSASPAATTQYTVTGYSSAGCSSTAFATITVNPKPNVNFNVIGSGCAPVQVMFQNLTAGNIVNASYQWIFGDGSTSSLFSPPPQTFDVPGNYDVKLIVKNGGCTASLVKPKVISVYPNPKAGFIIDNEVTDINKPYVHLFNRSIGDSIRYWDFGDGQTDLSGVMNPVHTYSDTGTYNICLVVSNSNGCVDRICNDITVKPIWSFYIPNAFTPNNDDSNDGFIGKSVNVTEHEMFIYDRWGVMIYTTGKTRNPETAKPWDGKPAGAAVPAQNDVYVWVVNLKDIEGMSHRLIGHVTLVK